MLSIAITTEYTAQISLRYTVSHGVSGLSAKSGGHVGGTSQAHSQWEGVHRDVHPRAAMAGDPHSPYESMIRNHVPDTTGGGS